MTAPSRSTAAGRAYLDLQRKARSDRRPVDELLQLYVLEAFLTRLAGARLGEQFILKGGVLLAAFGERRPTRDVDLQAHSLDNDVETVRAAVCEIASRSLDDGVAFEVQTATAEVIRDDDAYRGVRVSMDAQLATARPRFHVDVNVGDPIRPAPRPVHIPGLLGGEVVMLGYPLAMVHAEKVVTAISRGSFNTRWRDFADICLLSRHHGVDGTELVESIRHVAGHRRIELLALAGRLDGYGDIGQERWVAWRRKQRVEDRLPERFTEVVSAVVAFADPAIAGTVEARAWDPNAGAWS